MPEPAAAAAAPEEDQPIEAIWVNGEVPSVEVLDKLAERIRKLVSSLELPDRGSVPTPSIEESLKLLSEATTPEAATESTWRPVAKPMPNIFAMAAEAAKAPGPSERSRGVAFSGEAGETSRQHPAGQQSTSESAASPRTAAPPTSTLPKLGEALLGSLMKEQGEEDLPREPSASDVRRGTSSTASRDGGVSRHEQVVPVRDLKDLPPGWAAAYSEEYQCQYYFNRDLGISSWEWPTEGTGRSEDRRFEDMVNLSLAGGAPDVIVEL